MSYFLQISIIVICFAYVQLDIPEIRQPNGRILKVRKGDRVLSPLQYRGGPFTRVMWKKNNEVLRNGRNVRVVNSKGKSILEIKNTTREDSGLYRMFAENEYGRDQAAVQVVVLDVPDQPQKPVAFMTPNKNAKLKWSPPLHDGNSPIEAYRVEKLLSHRSWRVVGETSDLEMVMKGVVPGEEVVIRLLAMNKEGKSEPLVLKFKFHIAGSSATEGDGPRPRTRRPSSPPKFTKKSTGSGDESEAEGDGPRPRTRRPSSRPKFTKSGTSRRPKFTKKTTESGDESEEDDEDATGTERPGPSPRTRRTSSPPKFTKKSTGSGDESEEITGTGDESEGKSTKSKGKFTGSTEVTTDTANLAYAGSYEDYT